MSFHMLPLKVAASHASDPEPKRILEHDPGYAKNAKTRKKQHVQYLSVNYLPFSVNYLFKAVNPYFRIMVNIMFG